MTEIEHSGLNHLERVHHEPDRSDPDQSNPECFNFMSPNGPLRVVQHIRYKFDRRNRRRIVRPYIEYVFPNGERCHEPCDEKEVGCVEVEMEPESHGIVWMSRLPITFMSPKGHGTPFEPAEQHIMLHLPNYEPIQVMPSETQQPQGQASSCRPPPAQFPQGLSLARRSSAAGQHPHGQPFPWHSPPAQCPQEGQILPGHPPPGHPAQFLHPEPLPLCLNPGQPFPDQALPTQTSSNQPAPGGPPQICPIPSQHHLGELLPEESLPPQNLQHFSAEASHPQPNNIENQQVFQETVSFETPVPLQTELSDPISLYDNHMVMEELTLGDVYQEGMWPAYQATPNQTEGHTSTPHDQQFAPQQVEEVSVPAQYDYDDQEQDQWASLPPQPDQVSYQQDEEPSYLPPDQQVTDQQGNDARASDQLLDLLQQE